MLVQKDQESKSKVLYDAVSSDYELGTYDEFKEKLKDPSKRQALYDAISSDYNLGTYDEFESKINIQEEVPVKKKDTTELSSGDTSQDTSVVQENQNGDLKKESNPIPDVSFDVRTQKEIDPSVISKEQEVFTAPFDNQELTDKQKYSFSELIGNLSTSAVSDDFKDIGVNIDLNKELTDKEVDDALSPEYFTNKSKEYFDNKNRLNEYKLKLSELNSEANPTLAERYTSEIENLSKATSTEDEFFSKLSKGKATFGIFWDSDKQTAEFSDELKLELMNPTSTKEAKTMNKILSGEGKLSDKEFVIASAKRRLLKREAKAIKGAFSKLTPKELEDNKDKLFKLRDKYYTDLAEYTEENAHRIKNTFGATKGKREYAESQSNSATGDIGSTFLNQSLKMVGKAVSSPIDLAKFIWESTGWRKLKEGDTYDPSGYDASDSMMNTASYLADLNYTPESLEKFQLVDKDGNWDFSVAGAFKGAVRSAPFMIGVMLSNQNRRKLIKGGLTYAGNPTKLKEMMGIVKSSAMLTLKDNVNSGYDIGLNPQQANVYGGFLSAMEGVTGVIMPDTHFLSKPFAKVIVKDFGEAVKKASTVRAYGIAMTNLSKKLGKELVEEEAMLVATSIANGIALDRDGLFDDFTDEVQQKQTVAVTLTLAGSISTAGIKADVNNERGIFYDFVKENATEYFNQLDELSKKDPSQRAENDEIKTKVALIADAVAKSPKNANGQIIELIAKKSQLEKNKEGKDAIFNESADAEIKLIDDTIRNVLYGDKTTNATEATTLETANDNLDSLFDELDILDEKINNKVGTEGEALRDVKKRAELESKINKAVVTRDKLANEESDTTNDNINLNVKQDTGVDTNQKEVVVKTVELQPSKEKRKPSKKLSEQLIKTAEYLESKRSISSIKDLSKLKGEVVPIAVVKMAWDGGLLVTAKAIRGGATVAKAIEEGLVKLHSTKWYKGLSKNSQEVADRRFYLEINDKYKEIEGVLKEREVYSRLATAEKETRAERGKLKSIRTRLKNRDKVERQAVAFIKKSISNKEFKELKKSEFNGLLSKIRDVKTDTGLGKLVTEVTELVDGIIFRGVNKQVDKLIKTKLVSSDKTASISKNASDVLNSLKGSNSLLDMTYSKLSEIQEKRTKAIIDEIGDNDLVNTLDNDSLLNAITIAIDIKKARNARKNEIARLHIESANQNIKDIIKTGKSTIKKQKEIAEAEKQNRLRLARQDSSRKTKEQQDIVSEYNLLDTTSADTKAKVEKLTDDSVSFMLNMKRIYPDLNVEDGINAIYESNNQVEIKGILSATFSKFSERNNMDAKIKKATSLRRFAVDALTRVSFDVDTMVSFISKKSSLGMLGGILHNYISDATRIASNEFIKLKEIYQSKIDSKLKDVYSKSYGIVTKRTGDLISSIFEDSNVEYEVNIYDKEGHKKKITKGEAMWLYNQFKNKKASIHFEKANLLEVDDFGKLRKDNNGEYILNKEITNILTKEDIEFADWLVDEFYPEMYPVINKMYKKLYYRNMPSNQFYSGALQFEGVENINEKEVIDNNSWDEKGTSLFFGSGIERITHRHPISTHVNLFTNLLHYVEEGSRFASSAEAYRNISQILNDKQVRNNIANYTSNRIVSRLQELVDYSFGFKNENTSNEFINLLILGKIMSSLALTPKLIVTQLMSTSLWLTEYPVSTLQQLTNPIDGIKAVREIFKHSSYIRDRYKNDATKLESSYKASRSKFVNRYKAVRLTANVANFGLRVGLSFIKLGDAGGILVLGSAYYINAKKEGMKKFNDEDKAIRYAINKFEKVASKTQQSYSSNDRDLIQHTPVGKIFNMYGNSPKQYFRNSVQALLELSRGMRGEEMKGDVVSNSFKFIMNHSIQGMLYQWVGTMMLGLLSDDDDDNTKMKDIFVKGAVFGSFSKFFILGDIIEGMWDSYEGKQFAKNSSLAMLSSVDNLKTAMFDYKKAEKAKDEVAMNEHLLEIGQYLAEIVGIPVGKTKSFTNNIKVVMDGNISNKEAIARLLNYSQYAIDNMNTDNKKAYEERKKKKASVTRKRRTSKTKKKGRVKM